MIHQHERVLQIYHQLPTNITAPQQNDSEEDLLVHEINILLHPLAQGLSLEKLTEYVDHLIRKYARIKGQVLFSNQYLRELLIKMYKFTHLEDKSKKPLVTMLRAWALNCNVGLVIYFYTTSQIKDK